MKKDMIIAVDFDGTCLTHNYPDLGVDIGAVPVLKKFSDRGWRFILLTMRDGKALQEAVNWFASNNIPLFGVNHNPDQSAWTYSNKIYANIYIDDANLGSPIVLNKNISDKPYVDWIKADRLLEEIYNGEGITGDTFSHKKIAGA